MSETEIMSKALQVIEGSKSMVEGSPSQLVAGLSPQDKATIMSLCMPKGANDSELALYLYRCKEQGSDPLSGELVLQKRVSQKDGSVTLSFITTRDALLKKPLRIVVGIAMSCILTRGQILTHINGLLTI